MWEFGQALPFDSSTSSAGPSQLRDRHPRRSTDRIGGALPQGWRRNRRHGQRARDVAASQRRNEAVSPLTDRAIPDTAQMRRAIISTLRSRIAVMNAKRRISQKTETRRRTSYLKCALNICIHQGTSMTVACLELDLVATTSGEAALRLVIRKPTSNPSGPNLMCVVPCSHLSPSFCAACLWPSRFMRCLSCCVPSPSSLCRAP